jgi:hypothetical protein
MASIVFGWPAATLSLVVTLVGLVTGSRWLLLSAAVMGLPFFAYLELTPRFAGCSICSLLQFASAAAAWKHRPLLAAGLAAPAVVFIGHAMATI